MITATHLHRMIEAAGTYSGFFLAFLGCNDDPVEVSENDGGSQPLELCHQLEEELLHELQQGAPKGRVVQQALRTPQPAVEMNNLNTGRHSFRRLKLVYECFKPWNNLNFKGQFDRVYRRTHLNILIKITFNFLQFSLETFRFSFKGKIIRYHLKKINRKWHIPAF